MNSIDELITKALSNAPMREGYTVKELSELINKPWNETRWMLEVLEGRGLVRYVEIGRAKLFSLNKNTILE